MNDETRLPNTDSRQSLKNWKRVDVSFMWVKLEYLMPRAHRCIRLSLLTGMIYCVSFFIASHFCSSWDVDAGSEDVFARRRLEIGSTWDLFGCFVRHGGWMNDAKRMIKSLQILNFVWNFGDFQFQSFARHEATLNFKFASQFTPNLVRTFNNLQIRR